MQLHLFSCQPFSHTRFVSLCLQVSWPVTTRRAWRTPSCGWPSVEAGWLFSMQRAGPCCRTASRSESCSWWEQTTLTSLLDEKSPLHRSSWCEWDKSAHVTCYCRTACWDWSRSRFGLDPRTLWFISLTPTVCPATNNWLSTDTKWLVWQ